MWLKVINSYGHSDMDLSPGEGEYKHSVADTEAACTGHMNTKKVYGDLRQAGFGYGPLLLKNIRTDDGKHSLGKVCWADTAFTMPHGYESEMLMHTATLDAYIQASGQ